MRPTKKPKYPYFSSGPTNKIPAWNLKKLNAKYLGRYHRSNLIQDYIKLTISKIRLALRIPQNYEIFLLPGSSTGAMISVIWSLLTKKKKITSIVFDYWGLDWFNEIKKNNLKQELRKSLNGSMPNLYKIDKDNDLVFVWTGTSTGMSLNNLDFIMSSHSGLTICDATSAAFIYDLDWKKLDATVFSWQKALGSESQHGIVVLSPKAIDRLQENKKKKIPKILDLTNYSLPINTPSTLSLLDFNLSLDWFKKKGGINWGCSVSKENKKVIDNWIKKNKHFKFFCNEKKFQALSPSFLIFNRPIDSKLYEKILIFLEKEKIAYDIKSYRLAPNGIRIWTGPTILKKDLIILTNWLDWSFDNIK